MSKTVFFEINVFLFQVFNDIFILIIPTRKDRTTLRSDPSTIVGAERTGRAYFSIHAQPTVDQVGRKQPCYNPQADTVGLPEF